MEYKALQAELTTQPVECNGTETVNNANRSLLNDKIE
jgi:hypothetical protein